MRRASLASERLGAAGRPCSVPFNSHHFRCPIISTDRVPRFFPRETSSQPAFADIVHGHWPKRCGTSIFVGMRTKSWVGVAVLALSAAACSSDDGSAPAGSAITRMCNAVVATNCANGPTETSCQTGSAELASIASGASCTAQFDTMVDCLADAPWACDQTTLNAQSTGCDSTFDTFGTCLSNGMPSLTKICTAKVALNCENGPTQDECLKDEGLDVLNTAAHFCTAKNQALVKCESDATDWECSAGGFPIAPECTEQNQAVTRCL